MATSEVAKPTNEETRGLTLRELVLEVRLDVKSVRAQIDTHLLEHAQQRGMSQGEARLFGIARSSIAVIASVASIGVAVWSLIH